MKKMIKSLHMLVSTFQAHQGYWNIENIEPIIVTIDVWGNPIILFSKFSY